MSSERLLYKCERGANIVNKEREKERKRERERERESMLTQRTATLNVI